MDDLMVLLQELLHFEDQVVGVFLSLFELISESVNFFVKARLDAVEVNVVTLIVLGDRDLEVTLVSLVVIDVVMDSLQDVLLLLFDLPVE